MANNAQTSSTGSKDKDFLYYATAAVGVLITFGFGYLPPFGPITPMGMKVLGIFIGMIFLWSFTSILWPSLLGIVALMISGYAPPPVILQMSFGNPIPTLVLFAMVLFGAIQHSGVTRYISRWFLTRRVLNGRPVMFSFIFIYTTYVLVVLSADVLPPLLFMWAILYSVLDDVGYKKGDRYTAVMVIGTMFGAISGQAAKPFIGSALMIAGSYEQVSGLSLNYLHYMLFGFIMCSLGIVCFALLLKFVFRPDMSKIANISIERFLRDPLPPMNSNQKAMIACLFSYPVLILLPSILPLVGPVALLARLGPLGISMLYIVGLCLFKLNGQPVVSFKEIAGKYLIWDVYFLVCMAMAISAAMVGNGTGITDFMRESLNPILGGHSPTVFALILVAFCVSITQFANNGVMGVLLMPVIKVFAGQSGMNFEAVAVLIIFALHIAIVTPAASPFAAVLHGNKDWVSQKDVAGYGIVICIMTVLLYAVVGIPVMNMIY